MRSSTLTRSKSSDRKDGPGGVEEVTQAYEPSDEVLSILARHRISLTPPPERTGAHSVEWEGKSFVLPALPSPVGLREGAEVLNRKADEEEQEITISEIIDALPWDGAQAFEQAVRDLFGWGIWQPQKVMWFKIPPTLRTIKTGPGPDDKKQVFWGEMFIPQLDATLSTGTAVHEGRRIVFQIKGSIAKKNRYQLEGLVALARIYANERSIYKGQAIRMFVNENGTLDNNREPEFIKIDPRIEDELVFSDEVMAQINTNLFAPIEYPEACRKLGIPLKRGILFAGPYGVGKSMTAAVTAAKAVRKGWTFIMLDRVAGLKSVLDFAHRYAPVVVFAEDIDRVIAGERSVEIDDVLNTLDGVQGKAHEIVTVLTTNHPDKINHAMLRPGRLDAIVTVTPPDAVAAERLMRQYGRGQIKDDATLEKAGLALKGHIPAVIREAVERAKLSAIFRTGGHPDGLTDDDLVTAAGTMKTHLDLMAGDGPPRKSAAERLGDALTECVTGSLATADQVGAVDDTATATLDVARKILETVS